MYALYTGLPCRQLRREQAGEIIKAYEHAERRPSPAGKPPFEVRRIRVRLHTRYGWWARGRSH